jgi:hypothetical protein
MSEKPYAGHVTQHQRLFCGLYPEGVVYADRGATANGDYKRLAFLSYRGLRLTIEPDCPPFLADKIRKDAAMFKPGDHLVVTTCGQIVQLTAEPRP